MDKNHERHDGTYTNPSHRDTMPSVPLEIILVGEVGNHCQGRKPGGLPELSRAPDGFVELLRGGTGT